MARITTVAKAKASKHRRVCIRCREDIEVGQSYQHVQANRYAPKLMKHTECAPAFKASEMTSSKLASAYAGQEAAHEMLDGLDAASYDVGGADDFLDDVRAALEECASAAEECASEYEESIEAMPDGLREGPTAEEMQEKIDALQEFASNLDSSWSPSDEWSDVVGQIVDSPDDDEEEDEDERDAADLDDSDDDEVSPEVQEAWNQWVDEVISEAREAIDELEL